MASMYVNKVYSIVCGLSGLDAALESAYIHEYIDIMRVDGQDMNRCSNNARYKTEIKRTISLLKSGAPMNKT